MTHIMQDTEQGRSRRQRSRTDKAVDQTSQHTDNRRRTAGRKHHQRPFLGHTGSKYTLHDLALHLQRYRGLGSEIPSDEPHVTEIIERGVYLPGTPRALRRGYDHECHRNACLMWGKAPHEYDLMTGYAMGVDGIWLQHSWLVRKAGEVPVETTYTATLYLGFVMTEEEALRFWMANSGIPGSTPDWMKLVPEPLVPLCKQVAARHDAMKVDEPVSDAGPGAEAGDQEGGIER